MLTVSTATQSVHYLTVMEEVPLTELNLPLPGCELVPPYHIVPHIPPFAPRSRSLSISEFRRVDKRAVNILSIDIEVQCQGRSREIDFGTGMGVDGEYGVGHGFDHVGDDSWGILDVGVTVFGQLVVADTDADGQTGKVWRYCHSGWLCGVSGLVEDEMRGLWEGS